MKNPAPDVEKIIKIGGNQNLNNQNLLARRALGEFNEHVRSTLQKECFKSFQKRFGIHTKKRVKSENSMIYTIF